MYFYWTSLASPAVLLFISSGDLWLLDSIYTTGLTFENCDIFFLFLENSNSDKTYWFKPENFIKYFKKKK